MTNLPPIIYQAIGYLSLGSQLLLIILVVMYLLFLGSNKKTFKREINFLSDNALSFSFLIAIAATLGSLYLSEVAKFPPCKLCWYQRAFMYPQAVILGIAVFINDFKARKYILALSGIGSAIAIYHYALQFLPLNLPCSDEAVSCVAKQLFYYGYITIPLMSLTAFALIIVFMLMVRSSSRK